MIKVLYLHGSARAYCTRACLGNIQLIYCWFWCLGGLVGMGNAHVAESKGNMALRLG